MQVKRTCQRFYASIAFSLKVAVLGIFALSSGRAQTPSLAFQDKFECSNQTSFGTPGKFGWKALWSGDSWTTNLDQENYEPGKKSVAPKSTSLSGSFGGTAGAEDAYENILLTGSSLWTDTSIQADITMFSNNAVGLVLRYKDFGSYYACTMAGANGSVATCGGNAGVESSGRFVIHRVDTNQACSSTYELSPRSSFSPVMGQTYRMAFSISGDSLLCSVCNVVNNTCSTSSVNVVTDTSELPPGKSGLISWGAGKGASTDPTLFDNVAIFMSDPDADADGVSDAVEAAVGTDPDKKDSDGDTISDAEELWDHGNPADSDSDGKIDALDTDSDDDGKLDSDEAGDDKLSTRAVDSDQNGDCNGIADFRESGATGQPVASPTPVSPTDCDGDGLSNEEEISLGTETCDEDTDGDGLTDFREKQLGKDPFVKDVRLQGSGISAGCATNAGATALIAMLIAFIGLVARRQEESGN